MITNNRTFFNDSDPMGWKDNLPHTSGLYLIGNTVFNPITDEKFYLVKIGMSTNLFQRMRSYESSNPMVFHIDYKIIEPKIVCSRYKLKNEIGRIIKAEEEKYHEILKNVSLCGFDYSKEWFHVSEEIYKQICEKKFNFFEIEG